ncbi:MAG TPA: metal-dependent hydrolase, partial [Burkholderiaceae bacterium]
MPTILTHTAVPLALGLGLGSRLVPPRLLLAGVLAAMAPDLDGLGFDLGIPYASTYGHRGLLHSLAFAGLLALAASTAAGGLRTTRRGAFAFVLASAASHGLLDMMTTGGMGVAWFWPWSDARHFLPWRFIRVSPLSLHRLLGPVGRAVLRCELRTVWLPAVGVAAALWAARCGIGAW